MGNMIMQKPREDYLQQLVAGLIEGVILADHHGDLIFANDAALAMHGCSTMAELGKNATEYRQQFALHYLNHHRLKTEQYPFARLIAGEAFDKMTVSLTRADSKKAGDKKTDDEKGEDAFSRVLEMRGLLLCDDVDTANMLAIAVQDVSERASAEERFERSFASNPAPAVILRISDSRYIKANWGFLDMTGYSADEIIGHGLHEIDVLTDAEHRDATLSALAEHKTIAQQEAVIPLKEDERLSVIVAGQPVEVDEEPCMLLTFINIEARKIAEKNLRKSEEGIHKAFRLAPISMFMCTVEDWQIVDANDAFIALSGYPIDEIIGAYFSKFRRIPKRDAPLEHRAPLEASMRDREILLTRADGKIVNGLMSSEVIPIHTEDHILCVVKDITKRKRSESELAEAINSVMKDTSWFTNALLEKLAQLRHVGRVASDDTALDDLTPREREVLEKVCAGESNPRIAKSLGLSGNTVRNHVASIYSKIGVSRRSEAIVWGRERGLAVS